MPDLWVEFEFLALVADGTTPENNDIATESVPTG
jgi:hypothetical protein